MKKTIVSLSAILSLTTLCSLFSFPVYAESRPLTPVFEKKIADIDHDADFSENKLLVMTEPDTNESYLEAQIETKEVFCVFDDDAYDIYSIELDDGLALEDAMDVLAGSDKVIYVEPDYLMEQEAYVTPSGPFTEKDTIQWHHQVIHTFEAWDLISKLPSHGRTRVAVLDTNGNVFHNEITGTVNMTLSCDFSTGKKKALNYTKHVDHGTHVAGLINASSADGTKYFGVANGNNNDCVELVMISMGDLAGDKVDVAATVAAINYASKNGCKVANMSFGSTQVNGTIQTLQTAINSALDRGMVCVCSSGNSGDAALNYPASCRNTIAVGSLSVVNNKLVRSSFSTYGSVDVSAPGADIWSMDEHYGYMIMSGTSMSSPIVAGVISLVLAAEPSLSAKEAAKIVVDTATGLGDNKTGSGCVNAYAAVRKAISIKNSKYLPAEDTTLSSANTSVATNHDTPTKAKLVDYAVMITYLYRAIGNDDTNFFISETYYCSSHGFTACDYYNRYFSGSDFWKYTAKLSNEDFIDTLYNALFNRVATNREKTLALNYMKTFKNNRMAVVGAVLQDLSTWYSYDDMYPVVDFGNPRDSSYIWTRYLKV
ncbi:MAG: S8 family serine peptidase [Clostridiales bacterium]|nr:S8 family serine peptidase [Clostridiales bacterium]